jgi:ABC-type molybdate transport system substrate-binding protein
MRLSLGTMIAVALLTPWTAMAQTSLEGPLIVFNAGSLAKPFNDLLQEFRRRHPEVKPAQEAASRPRASSPSWAKSPTS